jgi:putative membrane protein insertion efficiency factor
MKQHLIQLIKFYQRYLSSDHSIFVKANNNPPYCRFYPSCSQYMIESIEKKGVFLGIIKWIWRICRCMPWSKGWYDPVEKK